MPGIFVGRLRTLKNNENEITYCPPGENEMKKTPYSTFSKRIAFNAPAMSEFKDDYTLMDMHVHTKYSHDSATSIKFLLKKAAKMKIGFAVTDHLRAEGAVEALKQKKVMIIPGIEIAALEDKEILLYFYSVRELVEFYEKNIKNRMTIHQIPKSALGRTIKSIKSELSMMELIERARKHNCLISIPHPYLSGIRKSHYFFDKRPGLLKKINAIEVLNASNRRFMNKRALKWAFKRKKAFTAGSDAHILNELGSAVVASKADNVEDFLDSIKKKQNFVIGREVRLPAVFRESWKSMKSKREYGWKKLSGSSRLESGLFSEEDD
jgi:predicted metal-dependent phosphoesterase TrpH